TDSCRCLIIFCNAESTSASPSAGLPAPRASMSAFLSVELTMRSVETARSFLAFIASVKALLMSSRRTIIVPPKYGCPPHSPERRRDGNNTIYPPYGVSPKHPQVQREDGSHYRKADHHSTFSFPPQSTKLCLWVYQSKLTLWRGTDRPRHRARLSKRCTSNRQLLPPN